MKLADMVKTVDALAVAGSLEAEITGITYDSRQVRPGNLFVALRGERTDGHRFVEAAVERGAAAVLLETKGDYNLRAARIQVVDTRRTDTCTGLVGTVQYEIGQRVIPAGRTTPESVDIQHLMSQMLQVGCGGVAMEVSSHALDRHRVDAVDFDVAVFTNLSQDHLDYHGSVKRYFAAKTKLFSALGTLRKAGRAVVNADDPYGCELSRRLGGDGTVVTYGVSSDALIRAQDIRVSAEGTYFVVRTPAGSIPISLPLIGRFNVSNALAATGAALVMGIDLGAIEKGLSQMKPVPGRLELVPGSGRTRVYIDYAHTEQALRNVLMTLSELTRGRLILVFGCGGDRDQGKRQPMGAAAAELAEYTILTTDNPRTEDPQRILEQVAQGFSPEAGQRHQVIPDRREAIERAIDLARPGDTVLVAGRGHESFQEFADTVIPFNDREIVDEYLNGSNPRTPKCDYVI